MPFTPKYSLVKEIPNPHRSRIELSSVKFKARAKQSKTRGASDDHGVSGVKLDGVIWTEDVGNAGRLSGPAVVSLRPYGNDNVRCRLRSCLSRLLHVSFTFLFVHSW